MARHYLVDGYNVILQDPRLDALQHHQGLRAARHALRDEAERMAHRTGCRVRLIFDGARDEFSHDDRSENEWVEVSFTSQDEQADERLVAVAAESRRRGIAVTVVSDDNAGVRRPLLAQGIDLASTGEFLRLLRPEAKPLPELRGEALSWRDRDALEREFLARDAEARLRARERKPVRAQATASPPPAAPGSGGAPSSPGEGRREPGPSAGAAPRAPGSAAPRAPVNEAERARLAARKARGARKQDRRLALRQSPRRGR
jgi:predicted RNA-binding protein with PIN domain